MIQNTQEIKRMLLNWMKQDAQLKSILLISHVFWIFLQNDGSQLCFRFFFLKFPWQGKVPLTTSSLGTGLPSLLIRFVSDRGHAASCVCSKTVTATTKMTSVFIGTSVDQCLYKTKKTVYKKEKCDHTLDFHTIQSRCITCSESTGCHNRHWHYTVSTNSDQWIIQSQVTNP